MRRLVSDAGMSVATVEQQLSPIDIDALVTGKTVTLETDAISAAIDAALALHDAADVLEHIGGSLRPPSDSLSISAATVETEAETALAAGGGEGAYVMLAARLLPASIGLPALAAALTDDPETVRHWQHLTVGELLSAFRDCPAELPAAVCDHSRVDLSDRWDSLDREALLRVADTCKLFR